MPKGRYWFFTLHKDCNHAGCDSPSPTYDDSKVEHLLYQLERGNANGRDHYQGVFTTIRAVSQKDAKTAITKCDGIHIEQCRSTAAFGYVTKEDTRIDGPWEHGIRRTSTVQGKRTDLSEACALIKSGSSIKAIATAHPTIYVKYHRGITALDNIIHEKLRDGTQPITIRVFYGASGTGKSRRAFGEYPDAYWKPVANKWWDGYTRQSVVVFDDFNGTDEIQPSELLSILDRYPRRVEGKGTSVSLSALTFIFTTNQHPSCWYSTSKHASYWFEHAYKAFERRLRDCNNEIEEFNDDP